MLIITGPGRCGTSMMARFVRALGYDHGGDVNAGITQESECSGGENPGVVHINHRILAAMRNKQPHAERMAIATVKLEVVKDPGFFHGTLPFWHEVRQDLKVLLLYRDADLVAASFRKGWGYFVSKINWPTQPDYLRAQFARCVEQMEDLGIPYRVLVYPQVIERFDDVREAFEYLDMELPAGARKVWAGLATRKHVHEKRGG